MSSLTVFKRQYYYYYGDVRSPLSLDYETKLTVDVAVVLLVSISERVFGMSNVTRQDSMGCCRRGVPLDRPLSPLCVCPYRPP